ncbi:MAG TPA: serine/threonine-protein kinase [Steroidobacteraceae bacterium]|nr:serine/threonine-protein kinase [Steroidobacteraceae bacterium]
MGVSELQRQFAAYGSGELEESQLRSMIRNALSREPQLGQEFIALTDACRRANVINPRLQSNIKADILEITSPTFDLTKIRVPAPGPGWAEAASFEPERAANSTGTNAPTGTAPVSGTAALQTGSGSTGSWGQADALNEVGAPLYPGAVLRDRFVLVEELGHGGMGVVYKAFDRNRGDMKDRYVAIKILSEAFKKHPLAVKSLQREARKAQRLAHPNIVTVHDFDRDGGNVFMVMELLSGRSLDQVVKEDGHGGIPLGPAREIIGALAAALSYAHQREIIHCDFKPSNAFLERDGRVKVLDFGIARAAPSLALEKADTTLFDAGQLGAVSPAYASFELLQGENPDVRDDVYSFACVAYELLSGLHPYQRIDAVKAFQMGLEPRPIRRLSRTQWRALKAGLAFRRVDRCASIDELAGQLLSAGPRSKLWIVSTVSAVAAAALAGALVWKGAQIQQTVSSWISTFHSQPARPAVAAARPIAAPQKALPPPLPVAPASQPKPAAEPQMPRESRPVQGKRVELEVLKEQFETQAIEGDVEGAAKTGAALLRAAPGSAYATVEVPRIAALAYARRARSQFMAGQVDEALHTLADGRRKFGRSTDLQEQEARYVSGADLYDRLSTAVVLNPVTTRQALEALKAMPGEDFGAMVQMLAQTLANRIADQRAAGRGSVADALEKAGVQLFPDSAQVLRSGQPGRLSVAPIEVRDP